MPDEAEWKFSETSPMIRKRFRDTLFCVTCVKRNKLKIGVPIKSTTEYVPANFEQNRSALPKIRRYGSLGRKFFLGSLT